MRTIAAQNDRTYGARQRLSYLGAAVGLNVRLRHDEPVMRIHTVHARWHRRNMPVLSDEQVVHASA